MGFDGDVSFVLGPWVPGFSQAHLRTLLGADLQMPVRPRVAIGWRSMSALDHKATHGGVLVSDFMRTAVVLSRALALTSLDRETKKSLRKMSLQIMFHRDVCLVCRECVLGDTVRPCGYRFHSAGLAEGLRLQVLCGRSERHRFRVYCRELPHEPVPCAQKMEPCKALEEMHVKLEEIPLEQYRARDELPLMQQRARGRADDRVTLPADLETMDVLTTAMPPPTLRSAEPRQFQNDFEDSFGTRRSQLISSAKIALPLLTSWDLLVVDKPAGAMPRSDKSTEQILAETTRPCPCCFVPIRRAKWCVYMM